MPSRAGPGIRTKLLLVLCVFLVIPFLAWGYVRELERVLSEAQEQKLAGTAQAVATALHDRARLFDMIPVPLETLDDDRAADAAGVRAAPHPAAVAEIAQILQGMSRTPSRIWVVDRNLGVLARTGSLHREPDAAVPSPSAPDRFWRAFERALSVPLRALGLDEPSESFAEEKAGATLRDARDVAGALAGILTTERRATPDGRATVVSAAHPIWVGDEVRGAVIVEETGNAVLAERNRAFVRLFGLVAAAVAVGAVALTVFASRLAARIRRLRDDAEAAIDAEGRVRSPLAGSGAGDEIGDLSRSFAAALDRLSQHAAYREAMAGRLSHELRTPLAVVRSSLDNLQASTLPDDARVYIERARGGLGRLSAILARMTEATRLEQSLADVERERFDLARLVAGCVDGYRIAYPSRPFDCEVPAGPLPIDGAPDLVAQMLDKLVANAHEFATPGTSVAVRLAREDGFARLAVGNEGPPLPQAMRGRLFDSMVSVRPAGGGDAPHLGLGLYIVRLVAEFHGGGVRADDRADGRGVVVAVTLRLGKNGVRPQIRGLTPEGSKMAAGSVAVDVGRHNFDEVVVQGSKSRPVLVDFWAPWCAPCRALAPVLDKLAAESAGRFTLAKLNTDDEPELAARYGIRGIPNVKAFADGAVVDEFTGVLPEGAVREFLARVVPSPAAALLAQAQALLARGDAVGALGPLDAAHALDPADETGFLVRAEALLALDRRDQAAMVLAELESPTRARTRPVKDERRLAALKAKVALAGGGGADLAALAAAAGKSPVDCAAKLAYADALAATGDYERALPELLAIAAADRAFDGDVGRRRMLTIFEALGSDSDLVRRYRRELAAVVNR